MSANDEMINYTQTNYLCTAKVAIARERGGVERKPYMCQ